MEQQLLVKMLLDAWESHNKRIDDLIEKLSDEQLAKPTAPGRNSGVYLLGHLTAVNDGMLTLLGLGEKLYPDMEPVFLSSPDNSGQTFPSVEELKSRWKKVNDTLRAHFAAMQPSDWFNRHTAVSEENFAKEPHRNKLNIIISRTNHQAYHLGQMNYLK